MRFTWPEIAAKAAAFSERHKAARYEKGETQTFYNEFFACFGIDRKQVAVYEQRVRNLPGDKAGFIDLFWPATLIVEQKSAGFDLRKASDQALDYFDWLPEPDRPRYILTCDFQRWHLVDLGDNRREWTFALSDLAKNVEAFAFVLGVQRQIFRNQKPANAKASELLGRIHGALATQHYTGHKLQLLLVRLLFILFADDTGIWDKDKFQTFLEDKTAVDGRDLGRWLTELFDVLNTASEDRQSGIDQALASFPHINGALFAEPIGTPVFDNETYRSLIDAGRFNWGEVSPAIFGALFESVIDKVAQRKAGAHYTPEEAIQRLIGPQFLDALWAEFETVRARKDGGRAAALALFHDKLAELTFLDPACGAGNFLVVTYRELRELERELLKELHPPAERQKVTDVATLSRLNVDQFFGIELDEFPARIAEVALWMTDHIANTRLGEDFGRAYARIPLVAAPGIRVGDALEIDWAEVIAPERCSHVIGNPPFAGSKMQSVAQRAQVRRLAKLGKSGGTLDYVAAWFLKAGEYARAGGPPFAFVATNSVCQGEQVAQLWPILFDRFALDIAFAHQTFVWPGKANVHCVIVGLIKRGAMPGPKRLFSYVEGKGAPVESNPEWMTAYLHAIGEGLRHQTVAEASRALDRAPRLVSGTQPIDDGHLIFDAAERARFLAEEPEAAPYLRPFVGSEEFLNGGGRWILVLQDAPPDRLARMHSVRDRLRKVRDFRSRSLRLSTLKIASTPTAFNVKVIPEARFLVVPEVSSELRPYVPMDWLDPPTIPSNLVRVMLDATPYHFAVLTSAMHMAWLRHIGGRLEMRYRYSIGLVYNTFPWPPEPAPSVRAKIEALADAVLAARALPKNAAATLAQLYTPDTMPAELHAAHAALDRAVDRLYRPGGFRTERERVEHLFALYRELVQPTAAAPRVNRRNARRTGHRIEGV